MTKLPSHALLLVLASSATALDNGLGRLPPLGWSSWNRWKAAVNETIVLDSARALQTTGLAALGYNHVNIDAGYLLHERHPATGKLQVDPAKFPRGMRYVADAVHAMGLKLEFTQIFRTQLHWARTRLA